MPDAAHASYFRDVKRIWIAVFALVTSPLAALAAAPKDFPLIESKDKAQALERENQDVLQRHYPFYAAYGNHQIKMQVSLKTPVVRKWPMYLGFTQKMFYVFEDKSKSFQDMTYNPECFYKWSLGGAGLVKGFDFGFFSHESNGKPGDTHRSYNKSYARMNLEKEGKRWLTRIGLQAQGLYSFETTNQDIQDYIGPLALNLSFVQLFEGWLDKSELMFEAFPGGKFANHWEKGGYQVSLSFRLGGIRLVPAFYFQYYYGYAETLLNYDRLVNAFRAGLIL